MVELSYAVAYPGTVMVHPLDALSANSTMVNSGFLDDFAFKAVTDFV